jgi:hypothetical protein
VELGGNILTRYQYFVVQTGDGMQRIRTAIESWLMGERKDAGKKLRDIKQRCVSAAVL